MNDKVTPSGIEGHTVGDIHFDVSGGWGGKRAVIARFRNEETGKDELYLYILVGPYWEVGGNDDAARSKWETAQLLTKAMENGVSVKALYEAIEQVIKDQED